MKKTIKPLALVLGCSAILIGSCKKDKTTDFRDSLVGSYACTTISGSSTPGGSTSDTVRDTIVVMTGSDSSISVNGGAFVFAGMVSSGLHFTGQVSNPISCTNLVVFSTSGASMYWENGCQTASTSSGSYTTGIKIH